MNTPNLTALLDCGHPAPALSADHTGGTGYGTDADGKRHCYACCAAIDRAAMVATGRATLYLVQREFTDSADGTKFKRWRVVNWPGSLEFPVRGPVSHGKGGFGAQRTDAWFAGPDGYVWHAINRGDNQIARCKRTKGRAS